MILLKEHFVGHHITYNETKTSNKAIDGHWSVLSLEAVLYDILVLYKVVLREKEKCFLKSVTQATQREKIGVLPTFVSLDEILKVTTN